MPVSLLLHFTVPLVDYDKPENNWNKLLNSFHLLSGPLSVVFLTQGEPILIKKMFFLMNNLVGGYKIGNVFPIWAVVAIVGTILCFAMLILTDHHTKPRYHWVIDFLYLSKR